MLSRLIIIQNLSITKLQLFLSFLAALIACRVLYNQHGAIQPDSVLYLEGARLFALGHWREAYGVFNWPFYSLCIATMHKISHFNIHQSAILLNVLFFSIATFSFLKIIELSGGKKLEVFIGALILFSNHNIISNTLGLLIRDVGFWAFFLTSLVFFIRLYKSRSFLDAFLWQMSIFVASLFRVEGIGFLLLLPISLFSLNKNEVYKNALSYVKANFINISLLILICLITILSPKISMADFGRLNEIFNVQVYNELTNKLFSSAELMSSQILGRYLQEFAIQGLLLTLVYAIIASLFHTTGLFTSLLGVLGLNAKGQFIDYQIRKILYVCAGIATLNIVIITIKAFVLTQRYILAFSFILMIFSSFYLAYLCKSLCTKRNVIKKLFAAFSIVYFSVNSIKNLLPIETDYFYQQEAITWLKLNNTLNKPVFYDESRLRYYAGEPFIGKFGRNNSILDTYIQNKSILNYEYLLIDCYTKCDATFSSKMNQSLPEFQEIKRFNTRNKKGYVAIYKKK